MNRKGQVTLFILIGILVVSAILVFFLWARPVYFGERTGIGGFEDCVREALDNSIAELSKNAGLIDVDFGYSYMGEEFAYLCYAEEFYRTCAVQVPFLKNVFDRNLELLVRGEVDACYDASLDSLRAQGYEITSGEINYNVEIEPGTVRMEIDAPTSVGGSQFAKFSVSTSSPIYETIMIATSIIQFEANYGDTDVSQLMLYYPDYYIEKIKRGEGTTLYILESKIFESKFGFASRSLVWPAGYNIEG